MNNCDHVLINTVTHYFCSKCRRSYTDRELAVQWDQQTKAAVVMVWPGDWVRDLGFRLRRARGNISYEEIQTHIFDLINKPAETMQPKHKIKPIGRRIWRWFFSRLK